MLDGVPAPGKMDVKWTLGFGPLEKMDVKWMCGSGPLENGCETDVGIHPSLQHGFDMAPALGLVLPMRNCELRAPPPALSLLSLATVR